MAKIEVTPDQLIIRMEGADKLWALKSELAIPRAHVIGAEPAEAEARGWFHGVRVGGTSLPGVITAGRFDRQRGHTNGSCRLTDLIRP